jgi:predicted nucleotidyltransferase
MNKNIPDEKALYFSRRLRQRIGKNVRKVYLFGSRARGDYHEGSDYDFLVLLDKKDQAQKDEVLENEVEFLNTFNELSVCVVYDEKNWEWRKNSPLGINIEREGIML